MKWMGIRIVCRGSSSSAGSPFTISELQTYTGTVYDLPCPSDSDHLDNKAVWDLKRIFNKYFKDSGASRILGIPVQDFSERGTYSSDNIRILQIQRES
jgi:hypothetical protein